jgi:hypothetical protein
MMLFALRGHIVRQQTIAEFEENKHVWLQPSDHYIMTKSPSDSGRQTAAYLCEFSQQPFAECYCCNVTSRTVPNIALYCMERYWECPIFRQRVAQKKICQNGFEIVPKDK